MSPHLDYYPGARMDADTWKTPADSPAPARMEQQQHGGALRRGGANRGGPGRPTNAVRQLALRGAAQAVPRLIEIVTSQSSDPKDVVAAARVLLEFGLGRQINVDGQVEHEHRFVVEVPPVATDANEWVARHGKALSAGAS